MKIQIESYSIVLVMVFAFVMNPAFSMEPAITVWMSPVVVVASDGSIICKTTDLK